MGPESDHEAANHMHHAHSRDEPTVIPTHQTELNSLDNSVQAHTLTHHFSHSY